MFPEVAGPAEQLRWYEVSPEGDTLRVAEPRSVHAPEKSHVTALHAGRSLHAAWAAVME